MYGLLDLKSKRPVYNFLFSTSCRKCRLPSMGPIKPEHKQLPNPSTSSTGFLTELEELGSGHISDSLQMCYFQLRKFDKEGKLPSLTPSRYVQYPSEPGIRASRSPILGTQERLPGPIPQCLPQSRWAQAAPGFVLRAPQERGTSCPGQPWLWPSSIGRTW